MESNKRSIESMHLVNVHTQDHRRILTISPVPK